MIIFLVEWKLLACSIFDPDSEEGLPSYSLEKLRTIIIFNGSEQKVLFEGNTGLSKPDIDPEAAEAEWIVTLFLHSIILNQPEGSMES